tara:strand:- start:583 stop:984 length:402 start_codon:yes stop_codon:yes gene_type:complete
MRLIEHQSKRRKASTEFTIKETKMSRYYAIDQGYRYSENTAEYGFGDYPANLLCFLGAVEAASRKEAISKIKKIHKQASGYKVGFSGINGAWIMEENDLGSFRSVVEKDADSRLPAAAQVRHRVGQETLKHLS